MSAYETRLKILMPQHGSDMCMCVFTQCVNKNIPVFSAFWMYLKKVF